MTTFTAARLETASKNKVMPSKTVPFKIIKVSSTTFSNDEDEIRSTVSINRATPVQLTRLADRQLIYRTHEPVDEQVEKSAR